MSIRNTTAVLLRTLTLYRNRELTIIIAVVTGLGPTAHAAGLSPALGAFVAGMLLGSPVFATQVRADVSSLRVVLLTTILWRGRHGGRSDLDSAELVRRRSRSLFLTLGELAVIWAIFQALGSWRKPGQPSPAMARRE